MIYRNSYIINNKMCMRQYNDLIMRFCNLRVNSILGTFADIFSVVLFTILNEDEYTEEENLKHLFVCRFN